MRFTTLAIGFCALACATAANAAPELVQNGGFELTDNGQTGELTTNTNLLSWINGPGGYNLVIGSGQVDNGGVNTQYGPFQLHGPGNGTNNGLPATSPLGGNYLALDGAFNGQTGNQPTGTAISQLLNTIAGHTYAVTFAWAAAQQNGFTGDTTEQVQVGFWRPDAIDHRLPQPEPRLLRLDDADLHLHREDHERRPLVSRTRHAAGQSAVHPARRRHRHRYDQDARPRGGHARPARPGSRPRRRRAPPQVKPYRAEPPLRPPSVNGRPRPRRPFSFPPISVMRSGYE